MLAVEMVSVHRKDSVYAYLDLLETTVVKKLVSVKLAVVTGYVAKKLLNANVIKIGKEKFVMIKCVTLNATKTDTASKENAIAKINTQEITAYSKLVLWSVVGMDSATKEHASVTRDSLVMIAANNYVRIVVVETDNAQELQITNANVKRASKGSTVLRGFAFLSVG